jgi:hypothetical protein
VRGSCKDKALKLTYAFFLLGICSHLASASESGSETSVTIKKAQLNGDNGTQQIPIITNEAEYAAWVKKREGAGRISSVGKSKELLSQELSSKAPSSKTMSFKASSSSSKKINPH